MANSEKFGNWTENVRSERLSDALEWSRKGDRIALDYFQEISAERKSDQTIVTQADREIEQMLRDQIQSCYPGDSIVGEEGSDRVKGRYCWYLDPIDGTASYAAGLPIWAISIGIKNETSWIGGILSVSFLEDLYCGESNFTAKNGEPLNRQRPLFDDPEALLCVASDAHENYRISFPGKTRCLGSSAFHMILVVEGRACATLLSRIHIWDLAGVWALKQGVDCEFSLLGLYSKTPPEWPQLLRGKRSEEPLIFSSKEMIDRVMDYVEAQ